MGCRQKALEHGRLYRFLRELAADIAARMDRPKNDGAFGVGKGLGGAEGGLLLHHKSPVAANWRTARRPRGVDPSRMAGLLIRFPPGRRLTGARQWP